MGSVQRPPEMKQSRHLAGFNLSHQRCLPCWIMTGTRIFPDKSFTNGNKFRAWVIQTQTHITTYIKYVKHVSRRKDRTTNMSRTPKYASQERSTFSVHTLCCRVSSSTRLHTLPSFALRKNRGRRLVSLSHPVLGSKMVVQASAHARVLYHVVTNMSDDFLLHKAIGRIG